MKNLKLELGDFDYTKYVRVIEGRITQKRFKLINRYVRKYNYATRYPYGVSRNGHPYRCGCEHDCCGCLVSTQMFARFEHNKTTIELIQYFNY